MALKKLLFEFVSRRCLVSNRESMLTKKDRVPGVETSAALIGTVFSAFLLALKAMNAGPLWRDEVNTFNVAQMPSLRDLWNNLTSESFPPLWPLLLRGVSLLGLLNSDTSVRVVGLCVGLFFLASLWLCSRWMGARGPTLSIALLGCLPAFIFVVGANRAYGLACCLLVLSFGMIWRMLELRSKSRILWAGLACLLFVQCLYYDWIFLCAMLAGGATVTIRRRQWRMLWALTGIGAVSAASMLIYRSAVLRHLAYLPLLRDPFFQSSVVWYGFCDAVAARSSANPGGASGPLIWFWIGLAVIGMAAGIVIQRTLWHQARQPKADAAGSAPIRPDLGLFCVVSMIFGIVGNFLFLSRLQFFVQTWYYAGILTLCAISLDGILGANWPPLRFGGSLRIGLMATMMILGAMPAWEEAHTRRSNVDLAAAFLTQKASSGDLIVVDNVWEGITFARYYQGQVRWMTVPPIDSHKVHRKDLVLEMMTRPNAMAPVLRQITGALRGGHSVWLVGDFPVARPKASLPGLAPPPPPPPKLVTGWYLAPYLDWWNRQATTLLLEKASQEQIQDIPVLGAVNCLENVSVIRFSGYRSATAWSRSLKSSKRINRQLCLPLSGGTGVMELPALTAR